MNPPNSSCPVWLVLCIPLIAAPPARAQTGVELAGPAADAPPLAQWKIINPQTRKTLATVQRKWGLAAVPAGEYRLAIQPDGYDAREIQWGTVKVEQGKVSKIRIDSGLQLSGARDDDPALRYWYVYPEVGKDPVAAVSQRWGFTPLPPGKYRVTVLPEGYDARQLEWATFTVEAGKTVQLKIDSGVDLAGREIEDAVLRYWYVYRKGQKDPVAAVSQRWGFTPLTPGEYRLTVLPEGYGAKELEWAHFKVEAQKLARLKIDSGVDLTGRSKDDPPLRYWNLRTQNAAPAAVVYQRWGFTPLPPGKYQLSILPEGYGAQELPWSTIEVADTKTTRVAIDSGVEVFSSIKEAPLPDYWLLYKAKDGAKVSANHQRWGFAPMLPGDYLLSIRPQGYGSVELEWSTLKVESGKAVRIDLSSAVQLTGRSPQEPPLAYWYLDDAKTGKAAAVVHERWGLTLVPPGEYVLSILPTGYQAIKTKWTMLKVASGKSQQVAIDSGVELLPKTAGDAPPRWWHVYSPDDSTMIANVYERWGYAPLSPGKYHLRMRTPSEGDDDPPGKTLVVTPGQVLRVRIDELAPLKSRPVPAAVGLAVGAESGDTVVELRWNAPKGMKVRGYRVYRAGATRPIHGPTPLDTPRFTDLGLTNGKTYQYSVKALLEDGTEWAGYQTVAAVPGRH